MLRRLQKAGERFVQLQSFIRIPKKHFYRFEIPSKLPSFSSHLFFRQSWTKALGHFCVSGAFSHSHRSNPSLTPQTVLHVRTQNKRGMHSRYIFLYFLQYSISVGDNSSIFSLGAGLVWLSQKSVQGLGKARAIPHSLITCQYPRQNIILCTVICIH